MNPTPPGVPKTEVQSKWPPLLSRDNAKTPKGEKHGYGTAILYLSPAKSGGMGNLCPNASKGCIATCLNTAGRAQVFSHILTARQHKTELFYTQREDFLLHLKLEIMAHVRWCHRQGFQRVAIRLNGTSDFPWENYRQVLMDAWPPATRVQFYDYTKSPRRMLSYLSGNLPDNYQLIFSRSENLANQNQCQAFLALGGKVAVVFEKKPTEYWGYPVVDGDQHDLVFLHPKSTVIGLKPKGKARSDRSGFVVRKEAV